MKDLLRTTYRASRIEFLVLPFVLIATGYSAASYTGETNLFRTVVALLGLVGAHIAVNILNEVSDYRSGIDEQTEQTPFSGGSKTLLESDVNVKSVERIGQVFMGASIVIGFYFVATIGLIILPVFLLGVLIAYTYTDYLTNYTLGEFGMGLGLGALPVIGTDIVQDGTIGLVPIAVAVPISFLAFNLLLMNEFPDIEADREGGRKNLIHRFGRRVATRIYAAVALFTHISIPIIYVSTEVGSVILVSTVSVILLYRPIRWVVNNPTEKPNDKIIRDNLLWNIVTTGLIGLTLYIGLV